MSYLNNKLAGVLAASLGGAGMADAVVIISEIDLANNRVELVNTGDASIDLTDYWWCNRVNGSPFYSRIGTGNSTVDAGLSTGTLSGFGAGDILVLDIASSFLPDASGELGLYNNNTFGVSAAIEDYILWGGNGVRDAVAQGASIWTDNEFIDVSEIGLGETIQLTSGTPGNAAGDYFLGASSLGAIPEPSSLILTAVGVIGLGMRRKRS